MQVYASYNYRRDLTHVVKLPGMLSRARSLSRDEAETQEADVGKGDAGVSVHPPSMRQAVAWELAFRNIRQSEVSILIFSEPHLAIVHTAAKCKLTRNKSVAKAVVCNVYEHQAKHGESKCLLNTALMYGWLMFGSNLQLTSSQFGRKM